MCIEIYKAEKMINGSENWNIVRVHGLSATQLQMIRVYMLPECDRYADTLVRLPMFYDLEVEQVENICTFVREYCAL